MVHPRLLGYNTRRKKEKEMGKKKKKVPYIETLRKEEHPPIVTKEEVDKYFELHDKIAKRILFVYKGLMGESNPSIPIDCQSIEKLSLRWRGYETIEPALDGIEVVERELGWDYGDPCMEKTEAAIPTDYLWDENWIDTELARRKTEEEARKKFIAEQEAKRKKEVEENELKEYASLKRKTAAMKKKLIEKGKLKK